MVVLREHDCPGVQVETILDAGAAARAFFPPCGERANLPFAARQIVPRRIRDNSPG